MLFYGKESLLLISISPEEGLIKPASILARVDLPHPDSPTIPKDSFKFNSKPKETNHSCDECSSE